jgi:hydrogenase maturation factor
MQGECTAGLDMRQARAREPDDNACSRTAATSVKERARTDDDQPPSAGDRLLLAKGVPIEATTLLAREFPARLRGALTEAEIREARAT